MNTPQQPTAIGLNEAGISIDERSAKHTNGFVGLMAIVVATLGITGLSVLLALRESAGTLTPSFTTFGVVGIVVLALLLLICTTAITVVQPGETRVLTFFGTYIGTIRKPGFFTVAPFTAKKKINVRINNFETNELKVNDADGNPINIAAIIVWQVNNTAKAAFAVEDYTEFVHVQSEAALRHVASAHPYDNAAQDEPTLRGSMEQVADELATEVAERISLAGLEVVETRISTLAYAPEIAQAMLQRQQASAVIAAREKIVEGAVSMVQDALEQLEEAQVVALDDERKAAMVSNLLVVLCSDSQATPVVNTGTLYN
ncbi:MAG: SPFH domain-containing protein [Actinomycetaceae bacterium]|nr:SPFH domain-containing protein [Arcanobacterium sp.]MDD7687212.1 SPFH domain-containing protein [Actinomycetaceae bacterium]MDY5273491.1 SPFH domain-containing protein [Arcanobacterium sp.]